MSIGFKVLRRFVLENFDDLGRDDAFAMCKREIEGLRRGRVGELFDGKVDGETEVLENGYMIDSALGTPFMVSLAQYDTQDDGSHVTTMRAWMIDLDWECEE